MGEGFPFLDVVLFAMVAAFIVLRLRGVLGRRPDNSGPGQGLTSRRENSEENVISLPDKEQENPSQETQESLSDEEKAVLAGLTEIRLADRNFDPDEFLQGSKAAYEMVVTAYAVADDSVLSQLLSNDVYENFTGAIQDRMEQGHTLETTLIAIRSADIMEARVVVETSEVTVRFVADVVNVTRTEDGNIVSGDPDTAQEVTDFWTFSRHAGSADPNWQLVETRSPQ